MTKIKSYFGHALLLRGLANDEAGATSVLGGFFVLIFIAVPVILVYFIFPDQLSIALWTAGGFIAVLAGTSLYGVLLQIFPWVPGDSATLCRMRVRHERLGDEAAIRAVVTAAFGQADEADLVDRLRTSSCEQISLVATLYGEIIGHILFTPVAIEGDGKTSQAWGLAPMAVLPNYQRQFVGMQLIREGHNACAASDTPRVVVLGHSDYYPRFGYVPASHFGVTSEYDVPDEAFMAMELSPGAFDGVAGLVKYRPEFAGL